MPTLPKALSRAALAVALASGAALPAWAQKSDPTAHYPNKAITFIVPYAAGGSSDLRSRQIANKLSATLGQPVVIENRPGAGGNIGTGAIAKARPDGYTIGLGNFAPLAVNKALFENMGRPLNFDPATELAPIVLIETGPLVLAVARNSPFKTVQELIAAAKARPGALSFASGGMGGSHHLAGELLQQNTGVQMTHVAYKGGAPATNDLMAGTVDLMFEWIFALMPYVRGDEPKLRPLAITSAHRSPLLKDVPTFDELGIENMALSNWFGVVAPSGTPAPIVNRLNAAINQALQAPDIAQSIAAAGDEVGGGTPQAFDRFIQSETARWSALVKSHGIKPE